MSFPVEERFVQFPNHSYRRGKQRGLIGFLNGLPDEILKHSVTTIVRHDPNTDFRKAFGVGKNQTRNRPSDHIWRDVTVAAQYARDFLKSSAKAGTEGRMIRVNHYTQLFDTSITQLLRNDRKQNQSVHFSRSFSEFMWRHHIDMLIAEHPNECRIESRIASPFDQQISAHTITVFPAWPA